MGGTLCLQGGGEFAAACARMDAELLHRAAGRPVVVAPLASRVGGESRLAGQHGADYFHRLGAAEVSVAPDVRTDPAGAGAAFARAGLLMLPGGSPTTLRDVLQRTPAGGWLRQLLARGGVLVGASAGAMVLCGWTLPAAQGAPLPGLELVPDVLVLPHFPADPGRPERQRVAGLRRRLPPAVSILGLPECSGVRLDPDGGWFAVGAEPTTWFPGDGGPARRVAPGQRCPVPDLPGGTGDAEIG